MINFYLAERNIKEFIEAIKAFKDDKKLHFFIGFVMGIFDPFIFPSLMLITVKEIYDCNKKKPTGFSLADIMFGAVGFLLGYLSNTL